MAQVECDVRSLLNLGDLAAFERLLARCAGRTGHLPNDSAPAVQRGGSVDTARRWISVPQASLSVLICGGAEAYTQTGIAVRPWSAV